ncbi:MAG: hypothetical protein D6680_12450 [Cyanobacteria bacterium J007]|jgi:hypothetical protein|nr:MAG: hypothetical protein D6680_12450 [Cyanobacteria bacterium J007]
MRLELVMNGEIARIGRVYGGDSRDNRSPGLTEKSEESGCVRAKISKIDVLRFRQNAPQREEKKLSDFPVLVFPKFPGIHRRSLSIGNRVLVLNPFPDEDEKFSILKPRQGRVEDGPAI